MHKQLGQSRARAQRLVTLALAMAQRPVNRESLARDLGLYADPTKKAETLRRQFERDKDALREAGVPVIENDDAYFAPAPRSPGFTPSELDALAALGGLVADRETGAALGAFASHAEAYPDLRHDDRLLAALPDEPAARAVLDALDEEQAIGFRYQRVHDEPRDYVVEPWTLRLRRGLWYVLSWDDEARVAKHFRLDRIVGEVRGTYAATTPRPDVLPAFDPPAVHADVTVRLHGRGAFEARRLGADPDLDAATQQVVLPQVRDEVALAFALGQDAEILAPGELDDERHRRLQMVADLHALPQPAPPTFPDEDVPAPKALDLPRLRRLLLLPAWLAERVEVTVSEVARAFGVSAAEIEEDLDVLRDVTLPGIGDVVDTTVRDDGTIDHIVGATVPLQLDVLSRARVRSLVTACAALQPEPDAGLERLAARLEGTVVEAVDTGADVATLAALRDARDAGGSVTFLHRKRGSTSAAQRHLAPTRIDWSEGNVYVGGWDHERSAPRWFRLDRIVDVQPAETSTPPPGEVDLGPITYVPRGEETELVLRCTHVGSWVLARTPPAATVREEDGTVWAVVRTDTPEVVADHVMVAGGEAEIVSPGAWRHRVHERAALRA